MDGALLLRLAEQDLSRNLHPDPAASNWLSILLGLHLEVHDTSHNDDECIRHPIFRDLYPKSLHL